jgi:hypothetical protein
VNKTLVFVITTGRSGTGLLARQLSYLPKVTVEHEAEPYFQDVMRAGLINKNIIAKFWSNSKLPAIQKTIEPIYIETSHLFCKGFVEPLLELGSTPNLIILSRSERQVASSLYQLSTIPGRTEKALKYYLSPDDPDIFLPLLNWKDLHDYQLCFWYTLEIKIRQKFYSEIVKNRGGSISKLSFEELISGKGIYRIAKELNLPSPVRKYQIKQLLGIVPKVNSKEQSKQEISLSDINLNELEAEIYDKTNFFSLP